MHTKFQGALAWRLSRKGLMSAFLRLQEFQDQRAMLFCAQHGGMRLGETGRLVKGLGFFWALLRGSFGVYCVGVGFSGRFPESTKAAGVLCKRCRGLAASPSLGMQAGSGVYIHIYMYTYIHAYNLIRWTTLRLQKGKKQSER